MTRPDPLPSLSGPVALQGNPDQHPAWADLTDRQREAVNEVWDDIVNPALIHAQRIEARWHQVVIDHQDRADVWRRYALALEDAIRNGTPAPKRPKEASDAQS